jgi:hypothetical protein
MGAQSVCILVSHDMFCHCLLNQMDASIWFNKQCQTYHVTPKYAQIHLKDNNTCNIETNIFRDTRMQMAI